MGEIVVKKTGNVTRSVFPVALSLLSVFLLSLFLWEAFVKTEDGSAPPEQTSLFKKNENENLSTELENCIVSINGKDFSPHQLVRRRKMSQVWEFRPAVFDQNLTKDRGSLSSDNLMASESVAVKFTQYIEDSGHLQKERDAYRTLENCKREFGPSPYIVRGYPDVATCCDKPCIVLEYIDGKTLGDFVRRKPVVEALDIKNILLETLKGQEYIENCGYYVFDRHPRNLMVDEYLNVKHIDMGFFMPIKSKMKERWRKSVLTSIQWGTGAVLSQEAAHIGHFDIGFVDESEKRTFREVFSKIESESESLSVSNLIDMLETLL